MRNYLGFVAVSVLLLSCAEPEPAERNNPYDERAYNYIGKSSAEGSSSGVEAGEPFSSSGNEELSSSSAEPSSSSAEPSSSSEAESSSSIAPSSSSAEPSSSSAEPSSSSEAESSSSEESLPSSSSSIEELSSSSAGVSSSVETDNNPSSSSVVYSSSLAEPSSSSAEPSSSSEAESSSSSSSSYGGSCEGFVEGKTRQHYGEDKKQFCDERDGKKYVYVKIGTQTWFAENLNYDATDSRCYGDSQGWCSTYGKLYNWATAEAVCPTGWHLPSNAEWNVLIIFAGGANTANTAGTRLKAESGWNSQGNGTDDYGFSALPGGGSSNGSFSGVGAGGNWWSATEYDDSDAHNIYMIYNYNFARSHYYDKSNLYSVRCVQD